MGGHPPKKQDKLQKRRLKNKEEKEKEKDGASEDNRPKALKPAVV